MSNEKQTDKTRTAAATDDTAVAAAPMDAASTDDELDPAPGNAGLPDGQAKVWPWLRWQGPRYYAGVPTRGRGPDGELTPQEVAAYFGKRPGFYRQAVGTDQSYVRVAAPKPKE